MKKRQQRAATEADLEKQKDEIRRTFRTFKRNKITKAFGEVAAEDLFCPITKRLKELEEERFVPPPPLIEEDEGFVTPPPLIEDEEGFVPPPPSIEDEEDFVPPPPLIEDEEGFVPPPPPLPPTPPPIEEEEEVAAALRRTSGEPEVSRFLEKHKRINRIANDQQHHLPFQ